MHRGRLEMVYNVNNMDDVQIALDSESSYFKVLVEDIESLAHKLGATPESKASFLVYYKDSDGLLQVWDGK